MKTYKERYERFLHTGNPSTDVGNAILLHSEGDGSQLASLYAVENPEEIAREKLAEQERNRQQQQPVTNPGNQSTVLPGTSPTPPPVSPTPPSIDLPPVAEPELKLYLYLNGQQYGPYNRDVCKQLVTRGQLTPQTMVWMEGMAAWTPAGQVQALQSLFAPAMPDLPPTGMPPMPPVMPPM